MYIFLVSNLAGDLCSASMIAKRLESLGARSMTQDTDYDDLSSTDFDKYGSSALKAIMNAIMHFGSLPLISAPVDSQGEFFRGMTVSPFLIMVYSVISSATFFFFFFFLNRNR